MFWSYPQFISYPYYYPISYAFPEMQQNEKKDEKTPAVKRQEQGEQISNGQQNSKAQEKIQRVHITLTRQDLIKAGYQTTKNRWTDQEDKLLKRLCKVKNKNWKYIASMIPDRNQKMCYSRYRRLKLSCRKTWKKSQDNKILRLIKKYGNNWNQISNHFENRSAKILKQHYTNQLAPDVNKSQWTLEQDLKLIQLMNNYGKDWKLIETEMNGRPLIQLKNRFYGRIVRIEQNKNNLNSLQADNSVSSDNNEQYQKNNKDRYENREKQVIKQRK